MKPMQQMPPDFLHAEGSLSRPVVLFIHGLGMSRAMWAEPDAARFMGGMFPMRVMLVGFEGQPTVYQTLAARGYSVATWSQRRPVGPARAAIAELGLALHELFRRGHREVVLVGHSRGGIVARAAMGLPELFPPGLRLRGVVTISTPHGGTHLARWAGRIARVTNPLNNHIPPDMKGRAMTALKRSLSFLESAGVRELLHGSALLASLPAAPPEGVAAFSVGGTSPALVSVPGVFSFPASLSGLFPEGVLPDEIVPGRGDGLVSASSAVMPGTGGHLNVEANHAAVAVHPEVCAAVVRFMDGLEQ